MDAKWLDFALFVIKADRENIQLHPVILYVDGEAIDDVDNIRKKGGKKNEGEMSDAGSCLLYYVEPAQHQRWRVSIYCDYCGDNKDLTLPGRYLAAGTV